MNRQNLLILAIIGTGSILSGLAYGVTNGQIIVGDLTITGTCTGCGEPSFTTYATILNSTITPTHGNTIERLLVSNDGSILGYDQSRNSTIITKTGSFIAFAQDAGTNTGPYYNGQSQGGEYKIIVNDSTNTLFIYKNNILLQTKTITAANFFGGTLGTCAIGISGNGKYIAVYGDNSANDYNRLVILEGT